MSHLVRACGWLRRASVNSHRHGDFKTALKLMQIMTDYVEA